MSDRPILVFPSPAQVETPGLHGGPGRVVIPPTPARQKAQLEVKFNQIAASFRGVAPSVDGYEPEHVIVFEAANQLIELAKAAAHVPGLEWLSEWDTEDFEPDGDFRIEDSAGERVPQRLFALMSNQNAMDQIISMWTDWQQHPEERARRHFGPFKQLFRVLHDVRRWSAQDRILDTRVAEHWRQDLADKKESIRFEAELWYREDPAKREAAARAVKSVVAQASGRTIDEATIEGIRYHALLLECPAATIQAAIAALIERRETDLLRCEGVMFFRPSAQAMHAPICARESSPIAPITAPAPSGEPVVGLLDGLPLQRHVMLDGRLRFEDPDGFANSYRPGDAEHGTAMASLIVHGDLSFPQVPLARPIYVRPVFQSVDVGFGQRREEFPSDEIFLDIIFRAVRRIFIGEGGLPAVAPTVRVINLSIGNSWQPFVRDMSPLARLLDWLAWEHNVLFVVSAGNYGQDIELTVARDQYGTLAPQDAVGEAVKSIRDARINRRLLSPAEAMNAVTVGAVHADGAGAVALDGRVDLLRDQPHPSPINRLGLGMHRSVKPDVLLPGGRQLYRAVPTGTAARFSAVTAPMRAPGHRVASPDGRPGTLNNWAFTCGTSNATALATRLAAQVHDSLETLFASASPSPDRRLLPVLIKALLVHAASWPDQEGIIADLTSGVGEWQERKRITAAFFGFGAVEPERALVATDQRVLIVGVGYLSEDQAHRYAIPLPDILSGKKYRRRLTTTVAWLTPLNFKNRKYRAAQLYLSSEGTVGRLFGSAVDADEKLARRGTVQHMVYDTEQASVIDNSSDIVVQVNCRADASPLKSTQIPYGLACTLNVAAPISVNIYEPIQQRLAQRIPVRAR